MMARLIRYRVRSTGADCEPRTLEHYVYALTSADSVWSALGDQAQKLTVLHAEYVDRTPDDFTGMEWMTREMRGAYEHAKEIS